MVVVVAVAEVENGRRQLHENHGTPPMFVEWKVVAVGR